MAFIEGLGLGGHDSDSELSEGVGDEDTNEEMSMSTQETRLASAGHPGMSAPAPHAMTPPHNLGQGHEQGLGQGLAPGLPTTTTLPVSTTPFGGANVNLAPTAGNVTPPVVSVPSPDSHVETPMTDAGHSIDPDCYHY